MADEVKRSIKSIDDEIKTLTNHIKALQKDSRDLNKSLKLDPKNVTLTEAKVKNLNDQIETGKKKIEMLRAEIVQMKAEGKSMPEDFEKLNVKIAQTEVQIKSARAELKKMSDRELDEIAKKSEKVSKAAAGILAASAAVVTAYVTKGDEISKASSKFNVTAERYQSMLYIFDKITGQADAYTQALANVQTQQAALDKGSAKAVKAFEALGISQEDIAGKGTADVLDIIIQKLQQVEDYDSRVTAANMLLSSSGTNVAMIASASSNEIGELVGNLEKYGVMTQSSVDNAAEAMNKWENFTMKLQMWVMRLGEALTRLSPPLSAFLVSLLFVLTIAPKLIAIGKAVNTMLIALKATTIAFTPEIWAIVAAVLALVAAFALLTGTFDDIKSFTTDTRGFQSQIGGLSGNGQGGNVQNITYNDYSTMNNSIEYEADIDEVASKLRTKIKVGGN